ncbi:MAG TPA: alpha/beta hydrolase [Sphingomonas sp.]
MFHDRLSRMPVCLILPGLDGSSPDHWQSRWERERLGVERVMLGSWSQPSRNQWISRLEWSIAAASGPVVLVAHSLSCHLVAWWANLVGEGASRSVVGAMLVAPPDLDRFDTDPRLSAFAPSPRAVLPFPSVVVASRNDPFASFQRQREMAGNWLASVCDIGEAGHINGASGLGAWPAGQVILDRLLDHACAREERRFDDLIIRATPERIANVPG